MDSDIDMKDTYRLLNLLSPSNEDEASTKKYTDNLINTKLNNYFKKDGSVIMTGDFNTGGNKILNLRTPSSSHEPSTKNYTDSIFLKLDGTNKMTDNLDMNDKKIDNLDTPTDKDQPTPLGFSDLRYLQVSGTNKMSNRLNMNDKKIINLSQPTAEKDASNKKYVDDKLLINNVTLSNYLKKDGSTPLTGNLNLNSNKIINLSTPTSDTDVGHSNHEGNIQPSHYKDEFSYLMSSGAQWTDETDGGNSFLIKKNR